MTKIFILCFVLLCSNAFAKSANQCQQDCIVTYNNSIQACEDKDPTKGEDYFACLQPANEEYEACLQACSSTDKQ